MKWIENCYPRIAPNTGRLSGAAVDLLHGRKIVRLSAQSSIYDATVGDGDANLWRMKRLELDLFIADFVWVLVKIK